MTRMKVRAEGVIMLKFIRIKRSKNQTILRLEILIKLLLVRRIERKG